MDTIFSPAIIAVIGLLVSLIMGALRSVSGRIDALQPITKQIVVVAIAVLARFVGGWLGYELPGDLNAWTPEVLTPLIIALVAYGWHSVKEALVRARA